MSHESDSQLALFPLPEPEVTEQPLNPQFAIQNKLMQNIIGVLGVAQVIQEVADREQERADDMEKLAFIDPLTGLPNERAFNEGVARFHANAQRELASGNTGKTIKASFVAMDLDEFKTANDKHGHAHGDRMLQDLAAIMSGRIRPTDIAARLHGDEFAMILVGADPEEAQVVVEDIRALNEIIGNGTISAGIAAYNPDETPEENLKRADRTLYDAKEEGRNQVVLEI